MVSQLQSDMSSSVHRDRYLAMLSHDLRSALGSVIGALSQIDENGLDPIAARHHDSAILAARDASQLLDGILDLEAIEKNEFALDPTDTHLGEFLAAIERRWSSRAAAKSIALTVETAGDLPAFVNLDRGRIMRVVGNLVENGIKYTEKGAVRVIVDAADGFLSFHVSDTGPGFSEDALKTLFEFKGRPANAEKPGSGIGLYIAKTLLDQMGGAISVTNNGGAHLCARIPLSVVEAEEPPTDAGQLAVFPGSRSPDLSGLRILFAEDNMTNQLVVTQMLRAMGAEFETAPDGMEALQLFENGQFDVVLLDIEMPRMSGLDVLRRIRSRTDDLRNIPVIALTAYAMREHRERINEAGADGMIAKPILGLEEFGNAILQHASILPQAATDVSQAANDGAPTTENANSFEALETTIGADLMDELMSKVVIDLDDVREGIEAGLAKNDISKIKSASHVLISVAGAIGMEHTQHAAESLNRAAYRGDATKIADMAASCLTGIGEILRLADNRERHK